jgi:hypothetical protein
MKTLLLISGALLSSILPASAQDEYPRVEAFVGYSLASVSREETLRENASGFQLSGAVNVLRNLGLVADFGAQFWGGEGDDRVQKAIQYLAGPRVLLRAGRSTTFVHILFGAMTLGSFMPRTHYAGSIGGGLDVAVREHVGVRAFQLDYIPVRAGAQWRPTIRVGAGLTFN